MIIQSLSVVVPNRQCINQCKFCVSCMHPNNYENRMDIANPHYHQYYEEFVKRLAFARDNGCNTVMLTGNTEPQANRHFLSMFGIANKSLPSPFKWIEMQTTGVLLDCNYLSFLKNHVGVTTVSVSMSSFNNTQNQIQNGTPDSLWVDIKDLCCNLKDYDFNLRLSLNMCNAISQHSPEAVFKLAKAYGADQVTIRKLYHDGSNSPQSNWVKENATSDEWFNALTEFILSQGRELERLEYGRTKYSVMGMGTVFDDDCMAKERADVMPSTYKYLILQPDCHLYSQWDDNGSLIF